MSDPAFLLEKISAIPTPSLSDQYTKQELKDAEAYIRRRDEFNDIDLLIMLTLYEDAFGVVNPKTNEPILTAGGLLSHFYRGSLAYKLDLSSQKEIILSEFIERLKRFAGNDIYDLSIEGFVKQIEKMFQQDKITKEEVGEVFFCLKNFGIATNSPRFSESGEPLSWMDLQVLEKSVFNRNSNICPILSGDTGDDVKDGWLFLQVYCLLENKLNSELGDEALINEFDLDRGTKRVDAIKKIWAKARTLALQRNHEYGRSYYRTSSDPNYKKAVQALLTLRNSPDFRFLFEQFTAVGLINSRKSFVSSSPQS